MLTPRVALSSPAVTNTYRFTNFMHHFSFRAIGAVRLVLRRAVTPVLWKPGGARPSAQTRHRPVMFTCVQPLAVTFKDAGTVILKQAGGTRSCRDSTCRKNM